MTPGLQYFIENYIKIPQPDGGFESVVLRQHQIEFIKFMEEAQTKGTKIAILKKRQYIQ